LRGEVLVLGAHLVELLLGAVGLREAALAPPLEFVERFFAGADCLEVLGEGEVSCRVQI
jgi:hypothetical protein